MSQHVIDRLPHWVEGDLEAAELADIDRHLAECESCRTAAADLSSSQMVLREALASPFEAADRERLRSRVMNQIRVEAAPKPLRRLVTRPTLLATCAASLLLATLVWHRMSGGEAGIPPVVPAPPHQVAEPPAQPDLKMTASLHQTKALQHLHRRLAPRHTSEPPPSGEPARIEFQTSDPTIRIIWLAQAKDLPETNASLPEAP